MALFESYERRIDKINEVLQSYGISSIEAAKKITDDAGLNVYDLVKGVQPIAFDNAVWAYTLGVALGLKKGAKDAATASELIGEGLEAFCIPGSVAEQRNVGRGHGNLGAMLLRDETDCFVSASVPGMLGDQSFQLEKDISGEDLDVLNNTALAALR